MYAKDDDYLPSIARKIISERQAEFGHLANCRIGFLTSDKEKKSRGRLVYAETEKVSDKYKALTGLDFIITFYTENCDGISHKALEILMLHELNHVGYDPEDESCSIIPHDLEDFKEIVDKYGTDWIRR